MLDKKTYLAMKREIKCVCRKNLKELCEIMEFNDFEKNLLFKFYDGDTVQKICMDLCISAMTYNRYMHKILSKIYNYKNTH